MGARTKSLRSASSFAACAALAACSAAAPVRGLADSGADLHDASPYQRTDAGAPSDAANPDAPSDAADAPPSTDPRDARPPNDSSDSGPSPCGDAGILFCDGFEQGITHWTQTYVSGGSATVDSTHVHQGAHALHAHVDPVAAAGTAAFAYVQRIQPWPSHFFARFFAYQPSPLPPSPANLIDMVQASSPYAGIQVVFNPPSGSLAMDTWGTGQDQGWESKSGAISPDGWTCFEVEIDNTGETSHLYVDDTEVTDLARTDLGLPQLGNIGVGLSFFSPSVQGAVDLWIDDVVVSGTRIGCAE